jgi:muconolactone delta-isomerase
MEFLAEFEIRVPDGTPETDVEERTRAEAAAAARLVETGHLLRVWTREAPGGGTTTLGLYRADGRAELDRLLGALPLYPWMKITVTPLGLHPNDPADLGGSGPAPMSGRLPAPRLTPVYRLEAGLGDPLDVGEVSQGHRRIVPLTGGVFAGPELNGKLLPGASADWQIVLPDGTALGDIRYTLQTDGGALLYVRSRGVRHGSAEVLGRLARGEDVDPSDYVFRTSTQIETASRELDWLNKGVFISVGARRPGGVIYDTYLVA